MSSRTMSPMRLKATSRAPARWAERRKPGRVRTGWSGGSGSSGKTSEAARMWPERTASRRAGKSTTAARESRMKAAPGRMRAKAAASRKPWFSLVTAATTKTVSLVERTASREAGSTPCSREDRGREPGVEDADPGAEAGEEAGERAAEVAEADEADLGAGEEAGGGVAVAAPELAALAEGEVGVGDAAGEVEGEAEAELGDRLGEDGAGGDGVDAALEEVVVGHVVEEVRLDVEDAAELGHGGERRAREGRLADDVAGAGEVGGGEVGDALGVGFEDLVAACRRARASGVKIRSRVRGKGALIARGFMPAAGAGAISARMARAAARGSGAATIGRATTRWSAPAARAAAGVAMRFWSPGAAPAGRMPGVTMSLPAASGRARRRAASRGEAMTPSAPAAKARRARSSTRSARAPSRIRRGVEVGAVERGEDGDGEELRRGVAAAFGGGGDHVRVAVDGEEVGGDGGGEAAGGGGDGGADVEELHVEEDALALGLELAGEVEAAGGEEAEADLVEADLVAEGLGEGAGGGGVGEVEADDQAVIHGASSGCRGAVARSGGGCQASCAARTARKAAVSSARTERAGLGRRGGGGGARP